MINMLSSMLCNYVRLSGGWLGRGDTKEFQWTTNREKFGGV